MERVTSRLRHCGGRCGFTLGDCRWTSYRGYTIRITQTVRWDAVLMHATSGEMLPTKATSLLREGREVAIVRGRALVDVYANAEAARSARAA